MRRALNLVAGWSLLLLCLGGCARTDRAFNQVLTDFGLRPRPEADKQVIEGDIISRLSYLTERELDKFNANPANTEIKFEKIPGNPLGLGQFHKTVKVYEKAYPLEVTRERARQVQRAEKLRKRGYKGRVEYRYRIYSGKRFPSSDEARDSAADIGTDAVGREIYIYHFDETGVWDGKPGKLERRSEATGGRGVRMQSAVRGSDEGKAGSKRIEIGGTVRVRAESADVVDK